MSTDWFTKLKETLLTLVNNLWIANPNKTNKSLLSAIRKLLPLAICSMRKIKGSMT